MANQPKDDLFDHLFTGIKDFLNAPLPGTAPASQTENKTAEAADQPTAATAPVIEEGVLYDKLKEIFNTPLPGTGKTPADLADSTSSETEAASPAAIEQDWDTLRDRHKEERDQLKDRHKEEREALSTRHKQEREAMKEQRKEMRKAKKKR